MEANTPQFDPEPDWKPLEKLVAAVHLDAFMHMGHVGDIQLYKHRMTRRYLNIDAVSGRCFQLSDGKYSPVAPEYAVEYVLEAPWK